MKLTIIVILLSLCASLYAAEPAPLFAQAQPAKPLDTKDAQPRMMGLYEQGWNEGVKIGDGNSGKFGWFVIGLPVVTCWLPWAVEPRRPAKPPVMAEEEYNSGYKNGYRAGWMNSHKTFAIIGGVVGAAAATTIILTSK